MRGYADITRSTSACVHFVDSEDIDAEDAELRSELEAAGVRLVYLDCHQFLSQPWELPNAIGVAAGTDHPPYDEGGDVKWVRWLDDLITLAHTTNGLVVVLDNANELFTSGRKLVTDLIESFLIQFHHWLERQKPCHLCLQMSPSPLVAQFFGQASTT